MAENDVSDREKLIPDASGEDVVGGADSVEKPEEGGDETLPMLLLLRPEEEEKNSSMPPPPPYAWPPYPGPGDASGQPRQYPPPGQGYSWQQPPTAYPGPPQPYAGAPPVTHPPALGGATPDTSAGYPVQPGYPGQPAYQPGYPAQPGYQGYPYQGYQTGPMATQTSSVTEVQGGPGVILAPQIAPPDYCGLACFACLFCFWPTGFCAILKSNETRHAINRGDLITANQLSKETRQLAFMTIGIGISIIVVIIIIRVALIIGPRFYN